MSGGSKTTTTNQTQTGERDSTGYAIKRPVAPEGWEDAWWAMQPGASGLSADQTTALAALRGNVGAGASRLAGAAGVFADAARGGPGGQSFLLGGPGAQVNAGVVGADLVGPVGPISVDAIGVDDISAERVAGQRGAEFMDLYRNPFEDQVVGASIRDLERAYARAKTAAGSRQQAAGAFGGSATALENALMADDFFNTVADTAGGLRARGFETAAGFGQTDAARMLQAGGMNQAAALEASRANQSARLDAARATQAARLEASRANQDAALRARIADQAARLQAAGMNQDAALRAAIQNQSNATQREMFDVDAAYRGQDARTAAARDWAATIAQGLGIDNETAMALLQGGGLGQQQLLQWLGGGLPLFGQEGFETGTEDLTGTTSGTSKTSGGGLLGALGPLGGFLGGLGDLAGGFAAFRS